MEGVPEKQWRRDAIWSVIVLIAAISFLLAFATNVYQTITGEGGEMQTPELAGKYVRIIIVMLSGGALLLFGYAAAMIAGVGLFRKTDTEPPAWNLWDVARAAAASYLGSSALANAGLAVAGLITEGRLAVDETSAQAIIVYTLILHVGIVALAIAFVGARGGSARSMGFTRRHWLRNLLHGIFGWLAVLPVFYGVMALVVWSLGKLGIEPRYNPVFPAFKETGQPWLKWLIIITVVLIGPVTEEVFFRGFLYPALRRKLPAATAIVLNGLLFALIHQGLSEILPIFVLGVAMAFLFEKTHSLVSCSVFHVCHNSLQMAIFLLTMQ